MNFIKSFISGIIGYYFNPMPMGINNVVVGNMALPHNMAAGAAPFVTPKYSIKGDIIYLLFVVGIYITAKHYNFGHHVSVPPL